MAMELKITSPSPEGFVKEIIWNADEIAAEVEKKVGYYKSLVYTDAQVVEAKKDRAQLNKFVAALKAKDREIKDLCLQPYEEFHAKMLKIISQVEEPVALIDTQIKGFEEDQKNQKREEIAELFASKGFQPWVTLDRIWNPKWLNKTYSMKQIDADLNETMYRIGNDIYLINNQGDGVQAALAEYKRTLDVGAAIQAAQKFIEAKNAEKAVADELRQRERDAHVFNTPGTVIGPDEADEELPGQVTIQLPIASATTAEAVPIPSDMRVVPMRKEIFFKVLCSREELAALNDFLKAHGYTYRQIREVKEQY